MRSKVLLFSSMTKVLDIIENYLKWREVDGKSMKFLRIDGNTALDQRDVAIKEFNDPGHNVFIFLLSIRAAGRGLNLQTSDTVIIYDPDPNPKSEEDEHVVTRVVEFFDRDITLIQGSVPVYPKELHALPVNFPPLQIVLDDVEDLGHGGEEPH